jgi:hypothetical protein
MKNDIADTACVLTIISPVLQDLIFKWLSIILSFWNFLHIGVISNMHIPNCNRYLLLFTYILGPLYIP